MRPTPPLLRSLPRRLVVPVAVAALMLLLLIWHLATPPAAEAQGTTTSAAAPQPAGPPWRVGRAEARFTVTLFADLECPYCRSYFPALKDWIDAHPEVNGQWHHLPLTAHEPIATTEARLAECAGEVGGHAAFFEAIDWIYRHTRGGGQGVPDILSYPGLTPTLRACLDSKRPQSVIQLQANEAVREGIAATPTLRLTDHTTGKSLLLHGPVEADALLSALDLLASDRPASRTTDATAMPVVAVDDMLR